MLVTMRRQVFDSLDHVALGWACFEPIILAYKNKMREQVCGNNFAVKLQFYKQLTNGQQALFMFRVYYNHASKSTAEFYWWSTYFLVQSTFSEVKVGLRYFGDYAMLRLLEETESFLEARNRQGIIEMSDVSFNNLDDDLELLTSISRLYVIFQEIAPATLKLIGTYIRNNPSEFVQIED